MKCREFADFIMDYLTDELSQESRVSFDRHIEQCGNCKEYVKQYGDTVSAGRAAFDHPDDELPSTVPEELVAAILASRKR